MKRKDLAHRNALGGDLKKKPGPEGKLTPEQVRMLRRAAAEGRSIPELAKQLGVHRMTAWRAAYYETWREVKD